MVIFVFCTIVVMLPIGVTGLYQLHDMVLIQQSRQYLESILPASYIYLDSTSVANGQPKFNPSRTSAAIRDLFNNWLPQNLAGRLTLTNISFINKRIIPTENHWLGADQPTYVPVITLVATLTGYQRTPIVLKHSVEFILD